MTLIVSSIMILITKLLGQEKNISLALSVDLRESSFNMTKGGMKILKLEA